MSFSKRQGLVPRSKPLQMESMDHDLKNSLWNVFYNDVLEVVRAPNQYYTHFIPFHHDFVVDFLKVPVNQPSNDYSAIATTIERLFFGKSWEWHRVYDLLDFFLDKNYVSKGYADNLNRILEREFSGYRVINRMIVPISNSVELEAIDTALEYGMNFTGFDGINIHLSKALSFLSDRDNPDYSAAIKEAISAVEAAAKMITGERTLGNALNRLESSGLEINNQLKESFNKIYNYSNDKTSGIRHAVVGDHQPPNFETAKFLVINSSAFVNYLMSLAERAGALR